MDFYGQLDFIQMILFDAAQDFLKHHLLRELRTADIIFLPYSFLAHLDFISIVIRFENVAELHIAFTITTFLPSLCDHAQLEILTSPFPRSQIDHILVTPSLALSTYHSFNTIARF